MSSCQCQMNCASNHLVDKHWFGSGCNLWIADTNGDAVNNSNSSSISSINNNNSQSDVFIMDSECCTSAFCDDFNSSFGFYSNVNSPPYHDNYINHMDHYHCNCTENVNSSGPVTATTTTTSTTTPMNNNPCTVKTESFQGRNEQSMSPMLSCVSPIVNSETHVISNSIGIQMKNNSNNSNSQPSVSFASSPRGNTVITHHPSSPFARVPRGPILKNEGNLKMPVQFSQPSTGSRISTYSTVDGDTVTATSTSASASAYSDNLSNDIPIPITDASTNGSSVISNESPLDSSKSSSKQSVRVNESQRTNSVYYESSQPAYTDDKIKSVGALTSMHNNNITTANNNNNPMGTGRGRPNVSSSYPTYEEAWDVKLARQLGVGVSRLPSILPISPTTVTAAAAPPNTTATPNHIPSLPSFPTGGGATPSQNSSSVCNKAKLTDDNVQTVETDFKALNITTNSSDDKSAKMTNFSEMLITDNKNVYDDDDDACNYKNKNNGKSVNGINQLFYHNEPNNDPSQRNSISSHMVNGKTELTENSTGEYDYAYNGSWNMGVKYNLNLAINNSSNDSSIIPTTPKYTNTPTTGITKTVKSSHCSNTIHSSNPHHTITSTPLPPPPPPAVPSHHHRHHPHSQKYGISSSQSSQESSRLSTVRNDTNDFKGRPASRPIPSVIPNDLDSISTDSCDESWDARHGQLVSELMRGRFIDPSVIVPTTSGKMMNPVTTTATGMTTESLYPLDKNVSIIPGSIPATTTLSSCTSSSSSTPSSSSSPSSSSTSASTASSSSTSVSHVVPLPSPLPSQCINTVPQLSSDQFNPSNGLRYPGNSVNKTKLSSSSQNNLPKGLPANLENLPLEEQPWFHPSLTRSEAEELIRNEPEGSFLVRPSETCPNDFSLTIKHKSFLHMRISRNSAGQYILGEYSQPYTSVSQMIYHYARTLVPVLGAYSVTLTHPVLRRI
uniref:SH2 domain-containing protein n=1 Tax=Trichobilharzia regenti TaxID=157069 RepID=A0AA85K0Y1_TRIRE|nr:unnamed protein product [Trichobilharzia regenti]